MSDNKKIEFVVLWTPQVMLITGTGDHVPVENAPAVDDFYMRFAATETVVDAFRVAPESAVEDAIAGEVEAAMLDMRDYLAGEVQDDGLARWGREDFVASLRQLWRYMLDQAKASA